MQKNVLINVPKKYVALKFKNGNERTWKFDYWIPENFEFSPEYSWDNTPIPINKPSSFNKQAWKKYSPTFS